MPRLGLGLARHRGSAAAVATTLPAGFVRNGAVNPRLAAMLARVRSGSGRGRIVFKGDSTTVGQGGGTTADPNRLTGARVNRPAAVMAARLTAAGVPTLDNAMVADNGLGGFPTVPLAAYDPRFGAGTPGWSVVPDQGFAGGGLLQNSAGGIASFAPDMPSDRFELVYYNAQNALLEFAIDGDAAAIASGPVNVQIGAGSGFGRVTLATAAVSAHQFQFVCRGAAGSVAVASVAGWNSTVPAIDILVDAALGATAADQAATGNGWRGLDHLAWIAPDLTIINLGLNDMAQGVTVDAYATSLGAMIDAARLSGDVLLVFPHPAAPAFAPADRQSAFRDAAAALAAQKQVAFLSLFDLFGGYTPEYGARLADGLVHGDAELYAAIGDAYAQTLLAMVT